MPTNDPIGDDWVNPFSFIGRQTGTLFRKTIRTDSSDPYGNLSRYDGDSFHTNPYPLDQRPYPPTGAIPQPCEAMSVPSTPSHYAPQQQSMLLPIRGPAHEQHRQLAFQGDGDGDTLSRTGSEGGGVKRKYGPANDQFTETALPPRTAPDSGRRHRQPYKRGEQPPTQPSVRSLPGTKHDGVSYSDLSSRMRTSIKGDGQWGQYHGEPSYNATIPTGRSTGTTGTGASSKKRPRQAAPIKSRSEPETLTLPGGLQYQYAPAISSSQNESCTIEGFKKSMFVHFMGNNDLSAEAYRLTLSGKLSRGDGPGKGYIKITVYMAVTDGFKGILKGGRKDSQTTSAFLCRYEVDQKGFSDFLQRSLEQQLMEDDLAPLWQHGPGAEAKGWKPLTSHKATFMAAYQALFDAQYDKWINLVKEDRSA